VLVRMALASTRLRLFWGALDFQAEQAKYPSYGSTEYVDAGDSAAAGAGVGVRRVTLSFDRSQATVADDNVQMHFDFMNITAGAADDTWTSGDYTSVETLLNTWWTSVKAFAPTDTRLSRYLWNRTGPGVPRPNPAERIVDLTPVAGSTSRAAIPQAAFAISLRHPIRRSWGRTYLPMGKGVTGSGRALSTDCDSIVAATVTLLQGAKSADFAPVVVSAQRNSALLIETVAVDDTVDIIRRRRWKKRNYIKSTAV
jgi:hypothetical protein